MITAIEGTWRCQKTQNHGGKEKLPCSKLTYPVPVWHFWVDDVPFPKSGYVSVPCRGNTSMSFVVYCHPHIIIEVTTKMFFFGLRDTFWYGKCSTTKKTAEKNTNAKNSASWVNVPFLGMVSENVTPTQRLVGSWIVTSPTFGGWSLATALLVITWLHHSCVCFLC